MYVFMLGLYMYLCMNACTMYAFMYARTYVRMYVCRLRSMSVGIYSCIYVCM